MLTPATTFEFSTHTPCSVSAYTLLVNTLETQHWGIKKGNYLEFEAWKSHLIST